MSIFAFSKRSVTCECSFFGMLPQLVGKTKKQHNFNVFLCNCQRTALSFSFKNAELGEIHTDLSNRRFKKSFLHEKSSNMWPIQHEPPCTDPLIREV